MIVIVVDYNGQSDFDVSQFNYISGHHCCPETKLA